MKIFISHATKEKPTVALPLYTQLKIHKLNPWIDQEDIAHSDSLFDAINSGLSGSLYAVAIVSPSFIQSEWTNAELQSIYSLMINKKIVRLFLIYHQISRGELLKHYPLLADNLAFDSSCGVELIAKKISDIVTIKSELKGLIDGKETTSTAQEDLPTIEESFYLLLNLQYEVERVEESYLNGVLKRLSKGERIRLMRLIAKDLILNSEEYAKLYEDVVLRIPHRGSDEEVVIDLSLIEDDVLVGILEKSLD